MPTVRAKIKCIATYEAEFDVPENTRNVMEYIYDQLPEADVQNLEFYDDLEGNSVISWQLIADDNDCAI